MIAVPDRIREPLASPRRMPHELSAMVRLKRAYEPAARDDGHRVLVDRLWPRGLSKEQAHVDEWLKDVAPSSELRTWFNHDASRWPKFQQRYASELRAAPAREGIDRIVARALEETLTLVYAARDEEHNNAVVLKRTIEREMGAPAAKKTVVSPKPKKAARTAKTSAAQKATSFAKKAGRVTGRR